MEERKRALWLLAASFGLTWMSIAMVAAPGPAAWVSLSGDPADAGLYFATFSLAAAAGAIVGGPAMDRFGRRAALVAAHVAAAAGFATAGVSYARGALATFALGTATLAFAIGIIYLTRVAAGEMFAPAERAAAVARVQVTATFGAVAGPLLLVASGPLSALVGRPADGFVWFLAPPLFLVSAGLVALAPEPMRLAHQEARAVAPGSARSFFGLPFLAAVAALVCAQAAMVTVMGVTGVELEHAGHTDITTSLVMALHFTGMFGLSLIVGRFAGRAGRRRTILVGVAILAAGGLVVAFVGGALGMAPGLLLVGLGWSFAYIGGTVLLTDVIPAAQRARVIGRVDFATSLLAAGASFLGGRWYAARGISGLGLAAVAVIVLPLVLVAILRESEGGAEPVTAGS